MFDLFGLKKEPEAQVPAEAAESSPQGPGSAKLWAAALVVDSLFVMVFGGALSAKVYQHWKAPAMPAAVSRPGKKPKAIEAAKTPVLVEAPTPAPAIPEPPKAAAPPPASGPKGARPSLLSEPPKGHQAPQPVTTGKPAAPAPATAPAAAPGAAAKAVPYEFRFKAPGAKTVELGGAFIVRNNGRKNMVHHPDGQWTLTLYLTPNTYRYFFLVDGKKTIDPTNPKTERGASVMVIEP